MYFVMVSLCDELSMIGDIDATEFYGPFRTRQKAEKQAARAEGSTTNFDIKTMVIKLKPGPIPRFTPEPNYND